MRQVTKFQNSKCKLKQYCFVHENNFKSIHKFIDLIKNIFLGTNLHCVIYHICQNIYDRKIHPCMDFSTLIFSENPPFFQAVSFWLQLILYIHL